MYYICSSTFTRGIFCHAVHSILQLGFPGTIPEKGLSLLVKLCFLEMEQKSCKEFSAEKGQQTAVALTALAGTE